MKTSNETQKTKPDEKKHKLQGIIKHLKVTFFDVIPIINKVSKMLAGFVQLSFHCSCSVNCARNENLSVVGSACSILFLVVLAIFPLS